MKLDNFHNFIIFKKDQNKNTSLKLIHTLTKLLIMTKSKIYKLKI